MNSIHLQRKRKKENTLKRRQTAHKRKKRSTQRSQSMESLRLSSSLTGTIPKWSGLRTGKEGSEMGNTLLGSLIDSTGLNHQELHRILIDRHHPARRNYPYLRHGIDRKVFSPIRYSRPYTSPSMRSPPIAKPVKKINTSSFLPNISEAETEDDYYESEFGTPPGSAQRTRNKVPFPSEERLSYLLPQDKNNSQSKRRRRNRGRRKTGINYNESKYDSNGRRKPNPELLLHMLERERERNIRRGFSVPFLRFFGSKGDFQGHLESSDDRIRSKNEKIEQKVIELKNQDAFEKRVLSEIQTHLRRERIRKIFKSQQQNNMIRDMKIFGHSTPLSRRRRNINSNKKKRRRRKKKRRFKKNKPRRRRFRNDESGIRSMSPIKKKKGRRRFLDDDDDDDDDYENENGGGDGDESFLNEWMKKHEEAVNESFHGSRGNTPRGVGVGPSGSPKDVFLGVKNMDKLTTTPGRYGGSSSGDENSKLSEVEKYRRKYDQPIQGMVSNSTGRVMFMKKNKMKSAWGSGSSSGEEGGNSNNVTILDDQSSPGGFFGSGSSSKLSSPSSSTFSSRQNRGKGAGRGPQGRTGGVGEGWLSSEEKKEFKKQKKYERYCRDVTKEIRVFEKRRMEREEYQEELKDIKVANQKLRFSKRIGRTKFYFNDPSNVYI